MWKYLRDAIRTHPFNFFALFVALAAAVFAGWSAWEAHLTRGSADKAAIEQKAEQKKTRDAAEAVDLADIYPVSMVVVEDGTFSGQSYQLTIKNLGQSAALNVGYFTHDAFGFVNTQVPTNFQHEGAIIHIADELRNSRELSVLVHGRIISNLIYGLTDEQVKQYSALPDFIWGMISYTDQLSQVEVNTKFCFYAEPGLGLPRPKTVLNRCFSF